MTLKFHKKQKFVHSIASLHENSFMISFLSFYCATQTIDPCVVRGKVWLNFRIIIKYSGFRFIIKYSGFRIMIKYSGFRIMIKYSGFRIIIKYSFVR